MTITEAQKRAVAKYNAANYDRIEIKVPKGQKQAVEAFAREQGDSVNGLVNRLLRDALGLSEDAWKNPAD